MTYKTRSVATISKTDSEISLIGKVLDVSENSFILSDDTGSIEIFSEEPVEKGKIVRVFCKIIEGRPKADIVQNLNNFDFNLYKKIKELYNRAGLEL